MVNEFRRGVRERISSATRPVGDGGPGSKLSIDEIYRGEPIEAFNADEFEDNSVDGHVFDVWHYEPAGSDDDPSLKAMDSLDGEITSHEKVDITGGFTSNIGTAFHFQTGGGFDLGLTLVMDTDRIEGNVVPIQYGIEWFDKHPGVLSRVETLADGEVRVDGELMGLVDTQAGSGKRVITKWGRERMESRANSPTYQREAEAVAFTSEVGLDAALKAAVGQYHRKSSVGGGLQPALNHLDGYSAMPASFRDERDTSAADDKQLTEWVYEETVDMANLDEQYIYILVTNEDIGTDDSLVERDNFAWVYDGAVFIEDYDDAADFVGRL